MVAQQLQRERLYGAGPSCLYRVLIRAEAGCPVVLASRLVRSGDELPWAREVERALRRAHVPVVMYRVP